MPAKKRFLILTSDSGFGHRSAANSIAKAIKNIHADDAEVSVVNPVFDEPSFAFLQKAEIDYDRNVNNFPGWYRFVYEISDTRSANMLVESTLTMALHKNLKQLVFKTQPDVIINTNQMYNAPVGSILFPMQERPPYFTVVTDLANVHSMWFNSNPNRYYVASDVVKSKAISRGINPDKVIVSGIPVDPDFAHENRTKSEIREGLGLDPHLTTFLVVGSKRVRDIPDYLKAMEMLSFPFQVAVIAGGDLDLYQSLQKVSWNFPIHILNYVKNIPEWMACADILISKAGGLILSEGLAAGLPIILINNLPGQEEGNVRFILDNHAGEMADTPWKFFRLVESWFNHDQKNIREISMNSKALGHPEAANVIADGIWRAAGEKITHYSKKPEFMVLA